LFLLPQQKLQEKDGTGDGVDTVATQNAAGETGTLHCSERTENSMAVSNPINLIPIGLDTAVISTAAGETSIGGYQHVVGRFSATDKGSAPSSVANADDSMERTETTVLTPKSSVRAPGGSGEGETSMFTTSGKDLLGQRLKRGVVIMWKYWWYIFELIS